MAWTSRAFAAKATWCCPEQEVHRRRCLLAVPSGGKGRGAGEGDSEDTFPLRSQPRRVCRPVPGRSGIARSRQAKSAEVESQGIRGRVHDVRSLANISVSRTVSRPGARRRCGGRGRNAGSPRGGAGDCSDEARRTELMAEIEALKAKINASVHRSDRHPLPAFRDGAEAGGAGCHVLPDGRLRVR